MWEKVKAWTYWAYEWITIIAVLVVSVLASVDVSPLFGADAALKTVTYVAILKAIAAFIESRRVAASK